MSALTLPMPPARPEAARRFSRAEYYRMAEVGILRPNERVELIEGEIIPMAPQGPEHAIVGDHLQELFARAFGSGYYVRAQRPLALGQASDPEPDIAVVSGSWTDYAAGHPTTALLVVEVAESSLSFDRQVKAGLYAAAGIADYWIVNLEQRLLEVYRQPGPDPLAPSGASYARTERLGVRKTAAPLAAPHVQIPVHDLMPPDARR